MRGDIQPGPQIHGMHQKGIKRNFTPYLMLAPLMLGLLLLVYYPLFSTIRLSFFRYAWNKPQAGMKFVGLTNYERIFTDKLEFWRDENPIDPPTRPVCVEGCQFGMVRAVCIKAQTRCQYPYRVRLITPPAVEITHQDNGLA